MRRQLGLCIELNHDRSIFLMKNGRIVRGIPVGNPSIGEETSFYPFEKKTAKRWQPILAPIVAAAAAIMLFMSVLVFPAEEAFGYVQVQINPGIELGLNDQYRVISIRELNSDGYDLIQQLGNWEGDSLHAVLDRVFNLAVTEQTTQVTVTAIEEDDSKLDQSVKKVVMAVSSDVKNEEFAIQMKEATKKQWRQSIENQVPVGPMIKKVEILKVQRPSEVQESKKELPMLPPPIENKARIEQSNSKEKNSNTEINENTPATDKKAVPPTVEKKSVPSATEIKKDDRSLKSEEQQKNQKQNNKIEKPSTKPQKAPPIKEQEKVKPTKTVPKEKPAENKENNQSETEENNQPEKKENNQPEKKENNLSEKKENNQLEKKKQGNSGDPEQQKKNDATAASSDSSNKYETQKSPESIQSPDHSKKNEQESHKTKENTSTNEKKPENKQKE